MSKVQTTKDYTKFKVIRGNRDVIDRHVDRLVATMAEQNLLQYFPIIVNEEMEVIDGQHRLRAARTMGMDVPYVVVEGLSLEDVQRINTAQKGWELSDWVNSYCEQRNEDYEKLRAFKERHGVSWTISGELTAAEGVRSGGDNGSKGMARVIREGDYKMGDKEQAEKIMEALVELQEYAPFVVKANGAFVSALNRAMRVPGFSLERLLSKLRDHNLSIEYQPTKKRFLLELERVYNFRAQKPLELLR